MDGTMDAQSYPEPATDSRELNAQEKIDGVVDLAEACLELTHKIHAQLFGATPAMEADTPPSKGHSHADSIEQIRGTLEDRLSPLLQEITRRS